MTKIAAFYSRISLEEQSEYSLASQTRAMAKLAKEEGFTTAPELQFVDDGYLGGEIDRPALTRLRKAVRSGAIQFVIVYDLDRLSRELAHLLILVDEFEKYAVKLVIVNGSIEDSPAGKLMMTIRGAFSQYEKSKIRERTMRGRREKAEQGFINGGTTLYGYQYEGKAQGTRGRLVIVPEQARVILQMFTWAAEGVGLRDICRRLDDDGVQPLKAKYWAKNVVGQMLANTTYFGEGRYNRRMIAEPKGARRKPAPEGKSKKTSARYRPESDWIIVPTPPIVSRELFEAVRAQMDKNKRLNVGRPSVYLLRGLIKCGKCGYSCLSTPNHGKPRYRCGNMDQATWERRCDQLSTPVSVIETQVWETVVAYAADPHRLYMEHQRETSPAVSGPDQSKQRAELERAVQKLKKQEFQATRSMIDPDLADSYDVFKAALKDCQKQIRALESQLTTLQPKPKARPAFVLPILQESYQKVLATAQTTEQRREAIRQRVERVELQDGVIVITFKPINGPDDNGTSGTNCLEHQTEKDNMYPGFSVRRKLA
jgi:site-specific DNA recombinase